MSKIGQLNQAAGIAGGWRRVREDMREYAANGGGPARYHGNWPICFFPTIRASRLHRFNVARAARLARYLRTAD